MTEQEMAHTLAAVIRCSQMVIELPDQDLIEGLGLTVDRRAEIFETLAAAGEALTLLLGIVDQARQRILAATADRAKPN